MGWLHKQSENLGQFRNIYRGANSRLMRLSLLVNPEAIEIISNSKLELGQNTAPGYQGPREKGNKS